MSRARQIFFGLAALAAISLHAQNPAAIVTPAKKNPTDTSPLLPPATVPPVMQFRSLLAMTPLERDRSLTARPPEVRARILAKVHEYLALPPDERELRLRATELRWYLSPLLRTAPADRDAGLARVPDDLRGIVESRLTQWDILPPPLQKEFLESDRPVHYFAHVEATNAAALAPERQKITEQFNQFFEFTPAEKISTLGTLSETERAQMAATLKTFEQLPPRQRQQCVKNFAKFASLTGAERTEFLKNAEQWAKMSPSERQSWRDLVAHVPEWPPLPQMGVPANLIPPTLPKISRPGVATN